MSEKQTTIGYADISKVLLQWLKTCPYIPKQSSGNPIRVEYEDFQDGKLSMSLSSNPMSVIMAEDVIGRMTLQHSYGIYIQIVPDGSLGKVEAEAILTRIAGWMVDPTNYPTFGDEFDIIKISQTNTPNQTAKRTDGSSVYQVLMEIQYSNK